MTKLSKPLVVTSGEPAGIGPDLCLALAASPWGKRIVVVADIDMLAERARIIGVDISLREYSFESSQDDSGLQVLPQPLQSTSPGRCRQVRRT